jgi:hypothetical protein
MHAHRKKKHACGSKPKRANHLIIIGRRSFITAAVAPAAATPTPTRFHLHTHTDAGTKQHKTTTHLRKKYIKVALASLSPIHKLPNPQLTITRTRSKAHTKIPQIGGTRARTKTINPV